MEDVSTLVRRLGESVGEAIHDPHSGVEVPPRTSWVDLQDEVLSVADGADPGDRRRLARALVEAVRNQPAFGPTNPLRTETFEFLLATLGDDLADALSDEGGAMYGGSRFIRRRAWELPGEAGARWLRHLALADTYSANSLDQQGRVPWTDDDWIARLHVLADLPVEPRPSILTVLFVQPVPKVASAALSRVVVAHGTDERDPLVRFAANHIRSLATGTAADADLYDWSHLVERPDLGRWIVELSSDPGRREEIVAAALRAGHFDASAAAVLSEPLDRPAWADGEVPWAVDSIEPVGSVRLPSRRLTAGDPWWTGGSEGLPWVVELDSDSIDVSVVVATHPLAGRECAALIANVDEGDVGRWELVPGGFDGLGYTVEVGVAGFGSVEFYDSGVLFDLVGDEMIATTAWMPVETPEHGGLAMCTVGPQHQLCRTWMGHSADGRVVRLVTDLGLLDLDLEARPDLPW